MTGTTAVEFLKKQNAIKARPAEVRIRDAELARDRATAERDIAVRELKKMAEERDMLARQLAALSHKHTDARVLLGMCLTTVKNYREHVEPRKLYHRLRNYFDLPDDAT